MIRQEFTRTHQAGTGQIAASRLWLLFLYIALYLVLLLPRTEYPFILLTTLVVTALSLWFGPLALIGSNSSRKIYDPATIFNSAAFYYSIKAAPLAWGERPPFLRVISYADIAQIYPVVALYVFLGLISWNLAYNSVMRSKPRQDQVPSLSDAASRPSKRRVGLELGVIFLTIIGVFSFIMLFRSIGESITVFLTNPWTRAYLADTTYGSGVSLAYFWMYGIYMLPTASLLWLALFGKQGRSPHLLWWLYSGLVLTILFLISPRANLVSFLISLLITYHLLVKRISLTVLGLAGLGTALYSYLTNLWRGIVGSMRTPTIDVGLTELTYRVNANEFLNFFGGVDLTDIRLFVLIQDAYGNTLPLKYGATLLRIVSQFIPRALWPSKPYDLGIEIVRLYDINTTSGTPPGFFPEMYMNFHVPGVLIGAFLLGASLAFLYKIWVQYPSNRVVGTVLYALTAPRIFLAVSSTLANSVTTTLIALVGASVALALSGELILRRRLAPPKIFGHVHPSESRLFR